MTAIEKRCQDDFFWRPDAWETRGNSVLWEHRRPQEGEKNHPDTFFFPRFARHAAWFMLEA